MSRNILKSTECNDLSNHYRISSASKPKNKDSLNRVMRCSSSDFNGLLITPVAQESWAFKEASLSCCVLVSPSLRLLSQVLAVNACQTTSLAGI